MGHVLSCRQKLCSELASLVLLELPRTMNLMNLMPFDCCEIRLMCLLGPSSVAIHPKRDAKAPPAKNNKIVPLIRLHCCALNSTFALLLDYIILSEENNGQGGETQ